MMLHGLINSHHSFLWSNLILCFALCEKLHNTCPCYFFFSTHFVLCSCKLKLVFLCTSDSCECQHHGLWNMSPVMRKQGFCICENKCAADQIWAATWENRIFAYAKTKTQISFTVTAKLISAFVFATWIEQSLYFLNPKFQVPSYF